MCAALIYLCTLWTAAPASAAGYPRRIAISPFAVLTKEDISATVSVLPRLLASRLMALAGADVVILPADGKAPEEAARAAKVPLLLQGTVSKLGKGYSIDATATDLETGKRAGAFFAAAATEDDIIAQLGALSGEIAEKLFGVLGVARAAVPAAPATPVSPAAPVSAAPSPFPVMQPAGGASAAAPVGSPPSASPASDAGWAPSSLKKIGQSDKIADEIYGVVAGDSDADGNAEVITWGRNTIYVYRVRGNDVLPYTRVSRSIQNHFLNVGAIDLDGDGKKDLVVTNLQGDKLASFVLLRKGEGFVETPGTVTYHLEVLKYWGGKSVLIGQRQGFSEAFQGKIYEMKWDGKALKEGKPLPLDTAILPVSAGGVYSLSPMPSGKESRWLYVDVEEKLRVLDDAGKSVYKSREKFGSAADAFEYGEYNRLEGKYPALPLRRAPRAAAVPQGEPVVVVTQPKKGVLEGMIGSAESSRVVVLQWEGSGFSERAASPKSDFFHTGAEVLPAGGTLRGGKVIASVIEQAGTAFKDRVSRLVLMRVE